MPTRSGSLSRAVAPGGLKTALTPRGGAASPRGCPAACKCARTPSVGPAGNGSSSSSSDSNAGAQTARIARSVQGTSPFSKSTLQPRKAAVASCPSRGLGSPTSEVELATASPRRTASAPSAANTGPETGLGRAPLSARRPGPPDLELPRAMVAAKSLVVRTGFELSTPKLAEVAVGTTVELFEMRQLPDYTTRALVAIQSGPCGWVTMIPKDGTISLVEPAGGSSGGGSSSREASVNEGDAGSAEGQPASCHSNARSSHGARPSIAKGESSAAGEQQRLMPTYIISSPKPLLARTEFDLQSGRVGELMPGTHVHVLESRPLPDGAGKRVRLALEANPGATYGWVTAITKSGQENVRACHSCRASITSAHFPTRLSRLPSAVGRPRLSLTKVDSARAYSCRPTSSK